MGELQREFDRHRVRIPIEAEDPETRTAGSIVYNGPVVISSGQGAQIAFNNDNVEQRHVAHHQIAPGFELLPQRLSRYCSSYPTWDCPVMSMKRLRLQQLNY